MLQDAVFSPARGGPHVPRLTTRTFKQVNHIRAKVRVRLGSILKKIPYSISVGKYKIKFYLRVGIFQNIFKRFPNLKQLSL